MGDWLRLLRDGDLVVVPQGTAEPLGLTRALAAGDRVPAVRLFVGVLQSGTFDHAAHLRFVSFGGMGRARRLVQAGWCEVVPCQLSQIPRLFEDVLRPDVVLLHLSGEARGGRHSVGIVDDYLSAAVRHARVVIGQVNDRMPFTHGSSTFALDDLDAYERIDTELLEVAEAPQDPVADAIADHVRPLIGDGSCVQLGIGSIPDAVLRVLHDRRDLGIHTGLMTDALMRLHLSGAVTNLGKGFAPGTSVAGTAFGTRALYDLLEKEESVRFAPVTVTHDHRVLSSIDRLVSVNSAVEVDLTGQINTEVVGGRYLGGVGGSLDFVRGAAS